MLPRPTVLSWSLPRWVKQQCEFAKQAQNPDQGPKLDLGFKEGQTIKLNIAVSPTLCGCVGHGHVTLVGTQPRLPLSSGFTSISAAGFTAHRPVPDLHLVHRDLCSQEAQRGAEEGRRGSVTEGAVNAQRRGRNWGPQQGFPEGPRCRKG